MYFHDFVSEPRAICASCAISSTRSAVLTEDEVIIGTIVAKCALPRKRKDAVARFREQSAILFRRIATDIIGPHAEAGEERLAQLHKQLCDAWVAYGISII